MNKDRIEGAPEIHRAHVALAMLAFGIQRVADGEHLRRQIDQRHFEFRFEIERIVTAARSKLENRARRRVARLSQHSRKERRLVRIVFGRREERPPFGELVVQLHRES